MMPELTFGEHRIIPSFYGKQCTTGLGMRDSFFFSYDQPEFISTDGNIVPGLGSVKVKWTFSGSKITSEFLFTVKNQIQLDRMRYMLCLGLPHSVHTLGTSLKLGPESLRAAVIKDDFQCEWAANETVTNDPAFRSYFGKLHYLQTLHRPHPLIMRPGAQYRLTIQFDPDIQMAEE